jgi:hypothetical protein
MPFTVTPSTPALASGSVTAGITGLLEARLAVYLLTAIDFRKSRRL